MELAHDPGRRVQLFAQPDLISTATGFTERLHPMSRHPEPVLAPAAPWETPGQGAFWGPLHVHAADGLTRLQYNSYGPFPAWLRHNPPLRCEAVSSDGVHFERPELGRYQWQGATANNIIGERGVETDVSHVVVDSQPFAPEEPPEYRYKGVVWQGRDERGFGRHGVSFSADRYTWQAYAGNPVFAYRDGGDVCSAASLRDWFEPQLPVAAPAARYAMFPKQLVQLGPWRRRCIAVCTAEEGTEVPYTSFSDPQVVIAPDQRDDDMAEERLAAAAPILMHDHPDDHRCEFYGIVTVRCGDTYLGFIWAYDAAYELTRRGQRNQYAICEVQLAVSSDLYHWRRVGDRQPVIARGAHDAFDSHMIFYHSEPLAVGDEWRIYYVGFNEGHAARMAYSKEQREQYWREVEAGRRHLPSIGLASVRREGLLSLDAGNEPGTVTTRPLRTDATALAVNADAGGGELRVAVLDAAGEALPGFSAADCQPLRGDGTRQAVRWQGDPSPAAWAGAPVRLAFSGTNVALYSFVLS